MEIKSNKIEPIQYTGSIAYFRAWMDRFLMLGSGRLFVPFPDKQRDEIIKKAIGDNNRAIKEKKPFNVIFDMSLWSWQLHIQYSEEDKDSNREVWYVHLYDPTVSQTTFVSNKWATILAVEQSPNNTIVEFLDGVIFRNGLLTGFPYTGVIGDMFADYAKFIKEMWEGKSKRSEQKSMGDTELNEHTLSSSNVFISYSHEDKEYAHKLAREFEHNGLIPWIDDLIGYGTIWPQVVQDNLNACLIFVVIMTPSAYKSTWVQNELTYAQTKKKSILPLLLDGDVWLSLSATQYVEVTDGNMPPQTFFTAIKKIIEIGSSDSAPNKSNQL